MGSESHGQAQPSDDVKRKFKEALERKNSRNESRGEDHRDATGAVTHTQGRADHSREFRRKSG